MRKTFCFSMALLGCVFLLPCKTFSKIDLDIESGAVFSGYNDIRIPGDNGTLFSLSEELKADPEAFYRIRMIYHFNENHHMGGLYAPLSINSTGQLDRPLSFQGQAFPANTPLIATYKFNSYRLFYRYDFLRKDKIEIGLGFTAKIRDAKIAVKSDAIESVKKNVGFVPIIHFRLLWKWTSHFAFLLDGDALAAPQGRAEDVLAALILHASDRIDLKAGYRILEGGADNDEVYTFSLFHYASIGAVFHF
jgi:hypothetical protein